MISEIVCPQSTLASQLAKDGSLPGELDALPIVKPELSGARVGKSPAGPATNVPSVIVRLWASYLCWLDCLALRLTCSAFNLALTSTAISDKPLVGNSAFRLALIDYLNRFSIDGQRFCQLLKQHHAVLSGSLPLQVMLGVCWSVEPERGPNWRSSFAIDRDTCPVHLPKQEVKQLTPEEIKEFKASDIDVFHMGNACQCVAQMGRYCSLCGHHRLDPVRDAVIDKLERVHCSDPESEARHLLNLLRGPAEPECQDSPSVAQSLLPIVSTRPTTTDETKTPLTPNDWLDRIVCSLQRNHCHDSTNVAASIIELVAKAEADGRPNVKSPIGSQDTKRLQPEAHDSKDNKMAAIVVASQDSTSIVSASPEAKEAALASAHTNGAQDACPTEGKHQCGACASPETNSHCCHQSKCYPLNYDFANEMLGSVTTAIDTFIGDKDMPRLMDQYIVSRKWTTGNALLNVISINPYKLPNVGHYIRNYFDTSFVKLMFDGEVLRIFDIEAIMTKKTTIVTSRVTRLQREVWQGYMVQIGESMTGEWGKAIRERAVKYAKRGFTIIMKYPDHAITYSPDDVDPGAKLAVLAPLHCRCKAPVAQPG